MRATVVGTDLQACCLFVGYPRSGHSLVGALLDAHPDVVVAHQANALRLVAEEGLGREELFEHLLADSARRAEEGRSQGKGNKKYSYAVPGQWQGRARTLKVIGDVNAGKTACRLAAAPSELDQFSGVVRVPLRLVHVVRNPYDMVATMARKKQKTVPNAIEGLSVMAGAVADLVDRGEHDVLTMHHERMLDDPHGELARLCDFIGVSASPEYLEACAGIVFPSPRRTRDKVAWRGSDLEALEAVVARHSFLQGYAFDS